MRLLIIEDDRESADYLVKAFREVGHVAELASDGEEGLSLADGGDYDVLVIDRMLPKRDGLSVIGSLRDKGNRTPALILSALGQVDDRIKGLRAGGDDYLPKPYSFAELLARVEVLSRRHGGPAEDTVYRVGDLELDRLSHQVKRGSTEITLQPREFRLLEYLMKHAGQVVTRTMLLENVWDYHFDPQTNVIDVHISRLRSKIDKGQERPLLHTIRGLFDLLKHNVVTNIGGMYAQRTGTREQLMSQHRELYDAIMQGRAEEAREISHRHISYVREVLEEAQDEVRRLERAQRRLGV